MSSIKRLRSISVASSGVYPGVYFQCVWLVCILHALSPELPHNMSRSVETKIEQVTSEHYTCDVTNVLLDRLVASNLNCCILDS